MLYLSLFRRHGISKTGPKVTASLRLHHFSLQKVSFFPLLSENRESCTPKIDLQTQCQLYQTSNGLFVKREKIHPKIHMETQRTQNSQKSWKQTVGSLTFPNFKIYYKDTVIKPVQYWHKDKTYRQMEIGMEIPNSCTYGHMVFDKGVRTIQWRKDSLFNLWMAPGTLKVHRQKWSWTP